MDALKKYGCHKIFHEKVSGISKSRPEIEKVKEILRAGMNWWFGILTD